jgi:hypothetical protein
MDDQIDHSRRAATIVVTPPHSSCGLNWRLHSSDCITALPISAEGTAEGPRSQAQGIPPDTCQDTCP